MRRSSFYTALLFVVGAAGLAWLGLEAADLVSEKALTKIDRAATLVGYLGSCLAAGAAAASWYRRHDIARFLRRERAPEFPAAGERLAEYRERADALVLPVSHRTQPEWLICQLKPKFVALLYTERSRGLAAQLAEDYSRVATFCPSTEEIRLGTHELSSPDDLPASKALVGQFLEQLTAKGIPRSRILVDTTGGKVPMSIGAFQAAEERQVASIYLRGKQPETNKAGFVDYWVKDPHAAEDGEVLYVSNPASAASNP